MQQTLTAKMQIVPQPSDRQLLLDAMKAYSAACSFVSAYVHEHAMPLSQIRIHDAVYRTCRSDHALPSQMAASVTRTVIATYKTIRTNQKRHTKRFSPRWPQASPGP